MTKTKVNAAASQLGAIQHRNIDGFFCYACWRIC